MGGGTVKPAAVRVGVGTQFVYNREVLEVIDMHPSPASLSPRERCANGHSADWLLTK
jgi:hypothetical protein